MASRGPRPKSPAQRLAALRRAEKILEELHADHPSGCHCVICDADVAVWKARVDITRPGYRGLVGVVERLPLDHPLPSTSTH